MWKPIIGILVLAALTGFAELPGFAQEPPEDFFTGNVQPLLSASCLSCHNQKVRSSGLALDARQDVLTGGNRGPAITAGSPDSSLMIQAVEHAGDLKMPLRRKAERPADRHSSAVDRARCCVALERIGCEGHCRPGPLGVSAAQTCNASPRSETPAGSAILSIGSFWRSWRPKASRLRLRRIGRLSCGGSAWT